jgi:serine protease Do
LTTTGGGRGGGVADASEGETAQPIPPNTKSAKPSAGSQNGVSGSSSAGEACELGAECGSVMGERPTFFHPADAPVKRIAACIRRCAMLFDVKRSLLGSGILALMALAPAARAQPADAPLAPAGAGSTTAQQLYQHVMHGVVAIERNGVPMAIGTVLSGDGRILTALSALGGIEGADVLYADGTIVHAKVGRSDRAFDLALLVPQSLKWTEGLRASGVDPASEDLRAMLPAVAAGGQAALAKGVRLGPVAAAVKGEVDAHARDGAALLRWLDVEMKAAPVAGAPLLDAAGDVAGVLVRACNGPAPEPTASADAPGNWASAATPAAAARPACKPVVLGAPVSAIRSFLSNAPTTTASRGPAPWLGIRGERELTGNVHGVRIVAVAPSSPAEKAGLKPSADVIVAVDGHPIDSPEKLADIIAQHAPGDTVKLLVFNADQFHEVSVALRAALAPAASTTLAPLP